LSSIQNIIREVKEEIAKLNQVLRLLEGTGIEVKRPAQEKSPARENSVRPRRKMSAAGRKRIAAAQRARWARIKAANKN